MGRTRQLRRSTVCLNCGTALVGNFCSECGQENTDYRVSLGRLLRDLAEEILNVQSRLWRSLWHLCRYPGRLTRDYNFGRRVRYTSPLRLYLLCSIAYFFVSVWVLKPPPIPIPAPQGQVDVLAKPLADPMLERFREHVVRLRANGDINRQLLAVVTTWTPRVVVALVPVFALLLMAFFRGRLYVEHLIFALHVHAFAFTLGALSLLTRSGAVGWALLLAIALWIAIALKNVYEQSWARTLWKGLAVGVLYLSLQLLVACALTMIWIFFF